MEITLLIGVEILKSLGTHAPTVFEDFEIDEKKAAITRRRLGIS